MCKKVGTFDIYTTNGAVQWLEFVLHIPGALNSHLDVELGIPTVDSFVFFSVPPVKCRYSTSYSD